MSDTPSPSAVPSDPQAMGVVLVALLDAAAITRLVVVDDDLHAIEDPDIDEIVGAAQENSALFHSLIPSLESIQKEESGLISSIVRQALEKSAAAFQAAQMISKDLRVSSPDVDTSSISSLRTLLESLPVATSLKHFWLSGTQWEEQEKSFLESTEGTIVLFDRDFSNEGKTSDHGLKLIANLVEKSTGSIFCALLSHTIPQNEELRRWEELSTEHSIPQDRFVIISKKRLAHEEPDLAGFLHLMRLAILCGPLKELRDHVQGHFDDAIKETRAKLERWSVFDFDEAIFKSSRNEGVWEGDTMLRVMTTFTTKAARSKFLSDQKIRQIINQARRTSSVEIGSKEIHSWPSLGLMALEYQRTELYSDGDHINQHHLPLELGDVFQKSGSSQQYILLAQPCDLMVRSNGKRSYDKDYTRMVPLCQIGLGPNQKGEHSYELPWWDESGKPATAHFADIHWVRLAVLDLCVANPDGVAKFSENAESPGELSTSWQSHIDRLSKHLKKECDEANAIEGYLSDSKNKVPENIKRIGRAKILPCCSNTGRFKSKLTADGFEANIQRVRRIASPLASDILRAYTRHQSRTAFEQAVITDEILDRIGLDAGG